MAHTRLINGRSGSTPRLKDGVSLTCSGIFLGVLAQLGERSDGIREVEGSIPSDSTGINMKILILDDDDTRHRRFGQWFAGFDVTHAFTLRQFMLAYKAGNYDYTFLDHDLNDNQYRSTEAIDGDNIEGYTGPCIKEQTGQDAAEFVAQDPTRAGHVVVHSWNDSGADRMISILKEAGVECTRWSFNPKDDLKLKQP